MSIKPCLIGFFGIFIILSLILLYNSPDKLSHFEIDSSEYHVFAQSLFSTSHSQPSMNMPSHTIGYSLFLGLLYKILGESIVSVIIVQILLSLCCGLLIYTIALLLFSPTVAYIAMALFSINLGFLVYSQILLSEILLVTLLLIFLQQFLYFIYHNNVSSLILSSFILGLSVLIKPVALFYIFFLIVLIWFYLQKSFLVKLKATFLFAFFFYLPVVGYMYYNYQKYHVFAVSPLINENLYDYYLPRHILPQLKQEDQKSFFNLKHLSKTEQLKKKQALFSKVLKQYPVTLAFIWIKNCMHTFLGLYTTQLKVMFNPAIKGGACSFRTTQGSLLKRLWNYITGGTSSYIIKVIALLESFWIPLEYILSLIALGYLFLAKEYFLSLFFISYIGYFTAITGHDGCGRYRLMFEPLLIILAAIGITLLCYKLSLLRKQKGKFYLPLISRTI